MTRPQLRMGHIRADDWLAEVRAAIGESEFWYLATPFTRYRFGPVTAFRNAFRLASILTAYRIVVYSPIAHHCIPSLIAPTLDLMQAAFWLEVTAPLRRRAGGLIIAEMEGWATSDGISQEVREFTDEGKPIYNLNRVVLHDLIRSLELKAAT